MGVFFVMRQIFQIVSLVMKVSTKTRIPIVYPVQRIASLVDKTILQSHAYPVSLAIVFMKITLVSLFVNSRVQLASKDSLHHANHALLVIF